MALFDEFPYLENDKIIIRKMDTNDVGALSKISNNEHVYKYISPFLYKKNESLLEAAIENQVGLKTLMAFVMPENVYSAKVLLNNGFTKEAYTAKETNWGGHDSVTVDVYTLVAQS